MGKTLSVIIPNYNQGEYLVESLDALQRQTRRPDEILVVDDGSTDQSLEVLRRYAVEDPSIRFIGLPENRGVATACQTGLAAVTGDLVYHSAADDPVLPKFVECSAALLEKYPQAGLCVTDFRGVHLNGDWVTSRFGIADKPCYISPERFIEFARRQDILFLPTHAATYHRQRQIECGGIIKPLKWHHDWFVAIVVALRHGICYHPESLKVLRYDTNSYSFTGQRDFAAQQEVLLEIFRLLASPAYADVREFFAIPSLLGRFGFKMVDLLLTHENLWPFFSWDLFCRALQSESSFLDKEDFRDIQCLDRSRQIENARGIMAAVAQQIERAADGLAAQRSYADAILWYYKLCDLRPDDADPLFKLGSCLFRNGYHKESVGLLERAYHLAPSSDEIRRALSDARQAVLRSEKAQVTWSGPWSSVWGRRDAPPYRCGQNLWAGPADTRPGPGVSSSVSALLWNLGNPGELATTLGDLASQTVMPGEVVIVGADPGRLFETWGERLPLLRRVSGPGQEQEPPWGQQSLSQARGQYLLFLSSGDRLHPDYLRRAVAAMEQVPKTGVCLSPVEALGGEESGALLLSPLELAERGDEGLVTQRGFLLRREAAHFPAQALAKMEWLGGWFLGLYASLSRGVCLLSEPMVHLNPAHPWAGEPAEGSVSDAQRRARVMGALFSTVMVNQLSYLRPLLAYGGFLARVGPALIKAAMAMSHLWSPDAMMVLQYPLQLWSRERAERVTARRDQTREDALVIMERGRQEVLRGDLGRAESTFSGLASRYPDMGAATAALAVLAGGQGDHARARDLLERACRQEPDNALNWLQLGRVYARLGDEERAGRAFRSVLQIQPDNLEARGHLGQTV